MGGGGSGDAGEVNLTPLLDVVLQLIMFFMITVNFVSVDKLSSKVKLPVAQALVPKDKDAEKEKKEIVDGFIYVNMDSSSEIVGIRTLTAKNQSRESIKAYFVEELEQYQRKAKREGREKARVILVVRADKEARYTKVYDLLEAARLAGIEDYQLRGMSQRGKKAE